MTDLGTMMREQALSGLQVALDKAVTDGDTVAARKVSDDIAKLSVSTAPKAPAYGNDDIKAQLDKQPWFGIDPKKSARVVELGKHMDPKKFATAELFAAALVKAVDEEFKPAPAGDTEQDEDADADDEDTDAEPAGGKKAAEEKKPRRTDGPNEGDANQRAAARRTSGPWAKITDAPADVQKEIKRATERFVSASAPKEQREKFVAGALQSHYAQHLRNKGKK